MLLHELVLLIRRSESNQLDRKPWAPSSSSSSSSSTSSSSTSFTTSTTSSSPPNPQDVSVTKPVLPKPLSLKDSLSARLPRSRSVTDRDVSGLTVIMGVTSSAPSASVKAGDKPFIPPVNGSTTYRYFSNGRKKELKNSLDIGSLPFYHPSHDHPLQLSRWFKGLWVRLVPPSLSLADGARNVTTLPVPNPKWRIAILGKVSTSVPMCSPPPPPLPLPQRSSLCISCVRSEDHRTVHIRYARRAS